MILLLSACAGDSETDGQKTQPTVTSIPTAPAAARPTYIVQRGTVQETLAFTGRWMPRDQTQLTFEVNGSIRSVNVQRGDTVSAGELLADFQITDLENQLATALLNLGWPQMQLNQAGRAARGRLSTPKAGERQYQPG
jgi:multidrug efflux pump subunit AcrA (membrane-fusion protein)